MDIGEVLDKIRPGAKYGRYDTYQDLVATWEDETPVPTLEELENTWALIQNPVLTKSQKLTLLNAQYDPQLQALLSANSAAGMSSTDPLIVQNKQVALGQQYRDLYAEKLQKRSDILNGII